MKIALPILLALAFAIGWVGSNIKSDREPDATPSPAASTAAQTTEAPQSDEPTTPTNDAILGEPFLPTVLVLDSPPPTFETTMTVASLLAPGIVLPSDCELPIGDAIFMPNSPRDYRSGIHKGIDFTCAERSRSASAAMGGRVVVAVGDYQEPTPNERDAILQIAAQVEETPPWILTMLYGNFVVIDHGVLPGIGHTVSLYAHLDSLDPAIVTGAVIDAGTRLGEIGNSGTSAAASGALDPGTVHLHWELYVDDVYLGAGLNTSETAQVYTALFSLE